MTEKKTNFDDFYATLLFHGGLDGICYSEHELTNDFSSYLTRVGRVTNIAGAQKTHAEMTMPSCEPIDLSLLPERPSFQKTDVSVQAKNSVLGPVVFEPGFDFVTEDLFNAVQELEASWRNEYVSAVRYTENHIDQIWTLKESLPLERLNSPDDTLYVFKDQEDLDDLAKLRTLYPELHMLSDFTLSGLYDNYQQDINYVGSYDIYREDDFLYYLIGIVSDPEGEPCLASDIGMFICCALLQGKPLKEAISFGKSVFYYDNALLKISSRIADAMKFLAQKKRVSPEE